MSSTANEQFLGNFHQAEALFQAGRLDESLATYEKLLVQQPEQVAVLNNIGLIYEKRRDFASAANYYQRANTIQPSQIVFVHNLANAYSHIGNWSEARPLLRQLIASDFQHENNCEKYALCLFTVGTKQDARSFVESVITRYPDNKVLNRLLGRTMLHLNDHTTGLNYLNKGSGVIHFDNSRASFIQ